MKDRHDRGLPSVFVEEPANKTRHAEQLNAQQVQQSLMQLLLISEKLPKDPQ